MDKKWSDSEVWTKTSHSSKNTHKAEKKSQNWDAVSCSVKGLLVRLWARFFKSSRDFGSSFGSDPVTHISKLLTVLYVLCTEPKVGRSASISQNERRVSKGKRGGEKFISPAVEMKRKQVKVSESGWSERFIFNSDNHKWNSWPVYLQGGMMSRISMNTKHDCRKKFGVNEINRLSSFIRIITEAGRTIFTNFHCFDCLFCSCQTSFNVKLFFIHLLSLVVRLFFPVLLFYSSSDWSLSRLLVKIHVFSAQILAG